MPADRRLSRCWRTPSPRGLLAAAVAAVALAAPGAPAVAGPAGEAAPSPMAGEPWFGPGLDWEQDRPADYAERLGETPSLYAQRVHYPLTEDDRGYLASFAEAASGQGAVALLTLEPQVALTSLTRDDAEVLATDLAALHDDLDTHFLVRFAPEMNGSWTIWGQQPQRYVSAFRTVAEAVHASEVSDAPHAEMVWAPAYGAGYPFGRSYGAVESAGGRVAGVLDTDRDGTVDDGDDPYAPYFPGERHVDWVGLSLYHYGDRQHFGNNAVPGAGELEARLDDSFGYGTRQRRTSFYDRYATSGRPMLVETSALYDTASERGAGELRLKRAWWRQVLAAVADHPAIGAISWLELTRPEAEIDDDVADWRATHTPALASALRHDLDASTVRLGPVTRVVADTAQTASAGPAASDDDSGGKTDDGTVAWRWIPLGLVLVGGAWAALRLTRKRA
ncbi:hypothetical protein ASG76_01595 [Nocardioides sp. Soil774]|uniref:hypothetical protein n=1 Tax=Nocardioides sp. Soil774 TaxID=1736408 RepID=UPI0006F9AD4B|nr:hypothetical protein [Nocardioides sp. Soil774]KRE97444.1 hypothetical protein ASG76_01595 [Nocardioides sp. Soil774]